MTTTEILSAEHHLATSQLTVIAGESSNDELNITLDTSDAGALWAAPTSPGETIERILGVETMTFQVGIPADEVAKGHLIAAHNGTVAIRTVALGTGSLTITNKRVIGLVWNSHTQTDALKATLNDDGNGTVIIFTVDRQHLGNRNIKKSMFGGKPKQITYTGVGILTLEGQLHILHDGTFTQASLAELEKALP